MAEVDPAKMPVVSGTDIWYHVRCDICWAALGLLANVESPEHTLFISDSEYNRCPKQSH